MQFLIQAEWVEQEADKREHHGHATRPSQKSFEDQKKQAFPTEKAYQQFLKTSGMTEADILFRVKLSQLQEKLTQKVTEDAKKVSDADVEEYYNKNKKRFAQPERRDLLVVLTKTAGEGRPGARRRSRAGSPGRTVVKQYSIDEASKAQGGKLASVAKGQQDKALEDAVFAASKGDLEGPVKTQFGWYVFEVEKITPASQQSLDQSRDTIKNLLRSSASRRRWTRSSRTSASSTRTRRTAPTTTASPSARTLPRTRRRHRPEPVEPARSRSTPTPTAPSTARAVASWRRPAISQPR